MPCKIINLVVLLLISLVTLSLAAPDTITPGQSIGHIRLGESASQATYPLGDPTGSDTSMGRAWSIWVSRSPFSSKPSELDVLTVRDASGLHEFVEQVRVTSPWFVTRQNIHVGSSLSAVLTAFPKAQLVSPDEAPAKHQVLALYDDKHQGITFEFVMSQHGLAQSRKCQAVLVHPKDKSVCDEYYPWYAEDDRGILRNNDILPDIK